jgi:hypothetical protein
MDPRPRTNTEKAAIDQHRSTHGETVLIRVGLWR